MTKNPKTEPKWKEEFDKRFPDDKAFGEGYTHGYFRFDFKHFISTQLEALIDEIDSPVDDYCENLGDWKEAKIQQLKSKWLTPTNTNN